MEATPLQRNDLVVRHEYYQPIYRVDFWQRCVPSPGSDPEKMGYRLEAYRIQGAKSVSDVRAWADENAGQRQAVIWIEVGPPDDRSTARVEGVDPTNPRAASGRVGADR